MPQTPPTKILARKEEIVTDFMLLLDKHIENIVSGEATEMYEIRDFALLMHIHPTHLSNIIKLETGKAPCFFYEEKIMNVARTLLSERRGTIADVALLLTFDPSNFTKFFKKFEGVTPKQYLAQQQRNNTETSAL